MAGGYSEEKNAGIYWLIFCVVGMVTSLTLYGIALEFVTIGGKKLHETSFIFVTTSIYTVTAYTCRWVFGEKPSDISKYNMLVLSCTSIASTFTSVRSLRYVIFPVQVLFKSCKPVPVMLFGTILGKRYPLQKYVNVMIITTGVALFMGGGASNNGGGETSMLGALMLTLSLCFDGATGAYEDKLMGNDHVEPFDLMYNIQFGKAVISFLFIVTTNQLTQFLQTLHTGGLMLIILGFTGALGQVFVFVTISKFGALNCALIGLGRKLLSLLLSFVLYGHSLNAIQVVGLLLSLAAMIANFKGKGGTKKETEGDANSKEKLPDDKVSLLSDTDNRDIEGGNGEGKSSVGNNPNAYSDNPMNNADDNSAIMLEMSMSTPIQASNKSEDKTDLLDFEVEFEEMDQGGSRDSSPSISFSPMPNTKVRGQQKVLNSSFTMNPFDDLSDSDSSRGTTPSSTMRPVNSPSRYSSNAESKLIGSDSGSNSGSNSSSSSSSSSAGAKSGGVEDPFVAIQRRIEEKLASPGGTVISDSGRKGKKSSNGGVGKTGNSV